MALTTVSPALLDTQAQYTGFKNRIINGNMVIDQRNNGASVTPTDTAYTLDRWSFRLSQASKFTTQKNAGSVTPPTGFANYLGVTSSSAYTVGASDFFTAVQYIEGYNLVDLAWGTASAQTVTLSFWVRSSLTGTFGGSFNNTNNTRSYPFSFSISSANTWEFKTVTVLGDTSGTWDTTTGRGVGVRFNLGAGSTYSGTAGVWSGSTFFAPTGAVSVVGTSGATFYITGVQLEKGTAATSFDVIDYGRQLAQCQRYYIKYLSGTGTNNKLASGIVDSTTAATLSFGAVPMRAAPTGTYSAGAAVYDASIQLITSVSSVSTIGATISASYTVASGLTAGRGALIRLNASTDYVDFSAEL